MKEASFPISDYPFFSKSSNKKIVEYNTRGDLAIAQSSFLTIFSEKNNNLEIVRSTDVYGSNILTISWCRGYKEDGWTPLTIFIGLKNGLLCLYDVISNKIIAKIEIQGEEPISSVADPFKTNRFYIGTSNFKIYALNFENDGTVEIHWIVQLPINPNKISISPFYPSQMYILSNTGQFTFLEKIRLKKPELKSDLTTFPVTPNSIIKSDYYPHVAGSLYLVTTSRVCLYIIDDNIFTHLYTIDSRNECLIGAHISPIRSDLLVLIFHNYIKTVHMAETGATASPPIKIPVTFDDHRPISATALFRHTLCVIGGGSLTFFDVNGQLQCKNVIHGLIAEPSDFDVYDDMVLFATKVGFVQIFLQNLLPKYILKIMNMPIIQVRWVDSDSFVCVGKSETKNCVIHYSLSKRKATSLLKPAQELIPCEKPRIFIAPNHQRFAINMNEDLTIIFEKDGSFIGNLIEHKASFIAFNNDATSIWAVSNNKKIVLYDLNGIKVLKKSSHIERWATAAVSINDTLIVAFGSGRLNAYKWSGESIGTIMLTKPILSLFANPKLKKIVGIDIEKQLLVFDPELKSYRKFERKVTNFAWLNDSWFLARFDLRKAVSVTSIKDCKTKFTPVLPEFEFSPDPGVRSISFIESMMAKDYDRLRKLGYSNIASILDNAPYLNFSLGHLKMLLSSMSAYLERTEARAAIHRRMWTCLMLGDVDKAVDAIMEDDEKDPQFERLATVAAVLTSPPSPIVAQIADKLAKSQRGVAAVDILMASKKYKEACEILIDLENYEAALHLGSMMLSGDDFTLLVKKVAESLNSKKLPFHAISLLVHIKAYDEADSILKIYMKLPISIAESLK